MYDEFINLGPGDVEPSGSVHTTTPDGQHLYVLSGYLAPVLKGGAGDWRRVTLRAQIPIPDLAPGQVFTATQWAPMVNLAAIASEVGDSVFGFAIDGCTLVGANTPQPALTLEVLAAARDVSVFLLRAGYSITVLGVIS